MNLPKEEGGLVANHYMYKVLEHFDHQLTKQLILDAKETPSIHGGAFQKTGHLINSLEVIREFAGSGHMTTPPDRLRNPQTRESFVKMILETWRDRGLGWSDRRGGY